MVPFPRPAVIFEVPAIYEWSQLAQVFPVQLFSRQKCGLTQYWAFTHYNVTVGWSLRNVALRLLLWYLWASQLDSEEWKNLILRSSSSKKSISCFVKSPIHVIILDFISIDCGTQFCHPLNVLAQISNLLAVHLCRQHFLHISVTMSKRSVSR